MKRRNTAPRRPRGSEPVSVPSLTAAQASALEIYDTTLRDGAQAEDVSFSVEDKLRVAQRLDELGVHFIEGGWPEVGVAVLCETLHGLANGLPRSLATGSNDRQ